MKLLDNTKHVSKEVKFASPYFRIDVRRLHETENAATNDRV